MLSRLGAARLSAAFPVSVVEGMLASIGLLIVAKELPHFIGHDFKSHAFFGILREVPEEIRLMDPKSFGVGIVCLALMFVLSMPKIRQRLAVPPPLVVVGVGDAPGLGPAGRLPPPDPHPRRHPGARDRPAGLPGLVLRIVRSPGRSSRAC